MNVNTYLDSYHKIKTFQANFERFEQLYSDKMKEQPKTRQAFEAIKNAIDEKDRKDYTYDKLQVKFCITDPKIIEANFLAKFGQGEKLDYDGSNEEQNDLTLEPGVTFNGPYGSVLKLDDDGFKLEGSLGDYKEEYWDTISDYARVLNQFVRYANNQSGKGYLKEDFEILKNALAQKGIDLKGAFVVNGVEFALRQDDEIDKTAITNHNMTWLSSHQLRKQMDYFIKEYAIDFKWDDNILYKTVKE